MPLSLAQFSLNPEILELEMEEGDDFTYLYLGIVNNFEEAKTFYWKFEEGEDVPEEWSIGIKDQNLCYNFGDYDCLSFFPNYLIPGDSTIFIIVVSNPGFTTGSSY
ncbi:MAG: hypothetical protein AAGA77_10020 [Bacteroidota bacterium]